MIAHVQRGQNLVHSVSQRATSLAAQAAEGNPADAEAVAMADEDGGENSGGVRETMPQLEKEVVKAALEEILGEIPAFRAFVQGAPRPPEDRRSGPEDAGTSRDSERDSSPTLGEQGS